MVNQERLRVQEERMKLLSQLQNEVLEELKKELTDKAKYKKLIKELIVQVLASLIVRALLDSWKTILNSVALAETMML
jgi:ABC-type phosphate transport system auxiliary subunit